MKKITFLSFLFVVSLGFSQNLLTNGDFETGDGSNWGGNSANGTNINVIDDGSGSNFVNQSIITMAGAGWQVGIDQAIALTGNETYRLSFVASVDAERTIIAGIGQAGGAFQSNTVTPTITTTPTTYEFDLLANFDTVVNGSRVLFDLGEAVSTVTLDDISLELVQTTCNNGVMDGDETGVDCGGSCPECIIPPSMAAPTPPLRAPADVLSFYGGNDNSYTDLTPGPNLDAGFCGAPAVTEVMIDGNNTLLYGGFACQGIDFSSNKQDASAFTNAHVDFYTTDTDLVGKVFNLKFVDFGGTGAEVPAGTIEVNINTGTTPAIVTGSWVTLDYVLPQSLATTLSDLAQIVITSNLTNVWYDNLYLSKGAPLSTNDFETDEFSVFPNPTNGEWNINSTTEMSKVSLFDILGKEVLTITPNATEAAIDASTFKTGVYFARIEGVSGIKTVKLIRQ